MLNEWTEFLQYTSPMTYTATGKRDNSYLGRFTYTTLTDFEGMARILTILARGYLFHDADGNILDENPKGRIDLARRCIRYGTCILQKLCPFVQHSGTSLAYFSIISGSTSKANLR